MKKVKLNLNRLHYSLIALFVVALLSVGVYALGTTPNPGHSLSQLQGCDSSGQTLIWSGTAWTCGTAYTSSGASSWVSDGSLVSYTSSSTSGVIARVIGSSLTTPSEGVSLETLISATGTKGVLRSALTAVQVGSVSNSPLNIITNNVPRISITSAGDVTVEGALSVYKTTSAWAGQFQNTASSAYDGSSVYLGGRDAGLIVDMKENTYGNTAFAVKGDYSNLFMVEGSGDTQINGNLELNGGLSVGGVEFFKVVEGTNPTCPSGYILASKYWAPKTCSSSYYSPCTTETIWKASAPTCTYTTSTLIGWQGTATCTAESWTKVVCKIDGI